MGVSVLQHYRPFCFEKAAMRTHARDGMSLYGPSGSRKYLNAAERRRFAEAARRADQLTCLFCLTLLWSGGRISEVLALTPAAIDIESGVANIETLKRRKRGIVRQVPLPPWTLRQLDRTFCLRPRQRDRCLAVRRLWSWSRTTAWRRVKAVMADAHITGTPAMPKGLRHAFGVTAFQSNVPPHLVQRWLGHASLKTTAIYGDVMGPEEREFAERMWRLVSHVETPLSGKDQYGDEAACVVQRRKRRSRCLRLDVLSGSLKRT
jgi:integrase/recombinase XerD